MPNKYQVGTVGGIRKVINIKAAASTATTIQGLENTSITLAQLKTLLGNTTTEVVNPGTPSAGAQTLSVTNGTTSVSNVTTLEVPAAVNVSAPGGNTAALTLPAPLTVTDGTHNVTAVSNLLFQNSVNVSSTTAGDAIVIMLPSLKVTDGSTLVTGVGELILSGASVSTTSTPNGVKITISGGGGGSLTITDGTTNVTSVTTILFSGASVSTTGSNEATVTVGGGSGYYNITPDSHTSTPGNNANDEFEYGSTIDTAGARFSGAIAWSPAGPSGLVTAVANGSIAIGGNTGSVNTNPVFYQTIVGPTSPWTILAKQNRFSAQYYSFGGIWAGQVATGKGWYFGRYPGNGNAVFINQQPVYAASSGITNPGGLVTIGALSSSLWFFEVYLQIVFDGTNIVFNYSVDGVVYNQVTSVVVSSYLTGNIDSFGLFGGSSSSVAALELFDFFRRTA